MTLLGREDGSVFRVTMTTDAAFLRDAAAIENVLDAVMQTALAELPDPSRFDVGELVLKFNPSSQGVRCTTASW